jgi:NAD(P)-dependent dehydrogenase (short-subunit alcohol dehydrogenase family)
MTVTLITGANKGLGFETAHQLVAAGHTVYAAARNPDNAQRAAQQLGALPLVVDVTDDASVQAAADRLAEEHGMLDVLVNNAGINGGGPKPLGECTGADMAAVLPSSPFFSAATTVWSSTSAAVWAPSPASMTPIEPSPVCPTCWPTRRPRRRCPC